jgi:hypothetical protein
MKFLSLIILAATLAACTTPMTTLRNPQTGQVVTCGGDSNAWQGSIVGYQSQKSTDRACVSAYQAQGFGVISQTE